MLFLEKISKIITRQAEPEVRLISRMHNNIDVKVFVHRPMYPRKQPENGFHCNMLLFTPCQATNTVNSFTEPST